MTDREKLIELRKKYGYGTDNYMAENFIKNGVKVFPNITKDINFAIEATDLNDEYSKGFRNALRYVLYLIDGKEPKYEQAVRTKSLNKPLTRKVIRDILCFWRWRR